MAVTSTEYTHDTTDTALRPSWVVDSNGKAWEYPVLPSEVSAALPEDVLVVHQTEAEGPEVPLARPSRRERPSASTYRMRRAVATLALAATVVAPSWLIMRGTGSGAQPQRVAAEAILSSQENTTDTSSAGATSLAEIYQNALANLQEAEVQPKPISQEVAREVGRTATTLSSPERRSEQGAGLESIGNIGRASAEEVQAVFDHLLTEHNITPRAAAYLLGNFIWEGGGLNPAAYNAAEHAFGLIQAQRGRENGMPTDDVYRQIDWLLDVEAVRDGMSPNLKAILTNPESSDDQIRSAIRLWIRWGETGERWTYANQILAALNK